MVPPPVALGLTLCDNVIIEDKTKKFTLVGGFSGIALSSFPATPPPFSAFAVLTDYQGNATIKLSGVRLETQEEVFSREAQIHFPNKLAEGRLHLRIKQCVFPAPGWYQFTLLVNGQWVAQRRVRVYLKADAS